MSSTMNIKTRRGFLKLLFGIAAHGFLLSMAFFLYSMFPAIVDSSRQANVELSPQMVHSIFWIFIGVLLYFISVAYFIFFTVKISNFSANKKILWVLL